MNKKSIVCFVCFALFLITTSDAIAQPRFFKANGLTIYYRWYQTPLVPFEGGDQWNRDGVSYGKSWLGNDTIVDGHECVEIWEQWDEKDEPLFRGFILEDENGYVYREYRNWDEQVFREEQWYFLYDFSRSDWKQGDSITIGQNWYGT